MRSNDQKNMIITLAGSYLDDQLQGRSLTFEGAGFSYSGHSAYGKEWTIYASPSQPTFRGSAIPLDVLHSCLVRSSDNVSIDPFKLIFPKGCLSLDNYEDLRIAKNRGIDIDFPEDIPPDLLVERVQGTYKRIYHHGNSSMLRGIGVKIRIPNSFIAERNFIKSFIGE